MSKRVDLTGQVFNNLTVLSFAYVRKSRAYWNCLCQCGNKHIASTTDLKTAEVKSCGCIKREAIIKSKTIHGLSKCREYEVWQKMNYRCYNVNDKDYKNYGGRGIGVCDRWRHSFSNFIEDMGMRPSKNHSLDRIDNMAGYSPNNCKWAKRTEQNTNKRNNKTFTYAGQTMVLTHWAKHLNVTNSHLQYHLKTKSFEEVYEYFS